MMNGMFGINDPAPLGLYGEDILFPGASHRV